ncbi:MULTISPECIES: hypothetical protein [Trichocoleus]|nr:hypothetical protein [Trichocoleus sp. FACHB-46]
MRSNNWSRANKYGDRAIEVSSTAIGSPNDQMCGDSDQGIS